MEAEGGVHLINTKDGSLIKKLEPGALRFSPDGTQFILITARSINKPTVGVQLFDTTTGDLVRQIAPKGECDATFTPCGQRLIIRKGEKIQLVNLQGKLIATFSDIQRAQKYELSPDETRLIVSATYHRIHIYNACTGKMVHQLSVKEPSVIESFTLNRDGTRMLTVNSTSGEQDTITLLSTQDGAVIHTFAADISEIGPEYLANFSPDGMKFAVTGRKAWLGISETGACTQRLTEDSVEQIRFSPDSSLLALTTGDTVKILPIAGHKK